MTPRSCLYLLSLVLLLPGGRAPLVEAASVTGRVVDSSESPIRGARVTLFTQGLTTFREARTDERGDYTIDGAVEGSYSLGASAIGFEYIEEIIVLGASGSSHDFSLGEEENPGRWTIVGNTLPEFLDATDIALLTSDGKVFYCHDTEDPVLFDPITAQKSFPQGSGKAQGCMNGTLLEDGRIIMVGGQNPGDAGSFRNAVPWVKTYSLQADAWTPLSDLRLEAGRWYPGLARLADGSLLAMGGGTRPNAARTASCERFDLSTEVWSFTGAMVNPCEFPPSALLYTGEVLATWWPPQLYDPVSGSWRTTGNFTQPNRGWPDHSDHSLVVLSDGRALAIGVRHGPDNNQFMGEMYDPVAEAWSVTSNPGLVRLQPEVVQLPDGRILVAAGETQVTPPPVPTTLGVVKWCDLYEPARNRWRRVADMNHFREYHAVTILVPDGRVLTTGGTLIKFQIGPTSADIESFEPPYLFRGVRPTISSLESAELSRGGTVSMEIEPLTGITSVVLMGTPSTTHWVDGGIRRHLVLQVKQDGSTVTVMLPTDPNVLPLGHYLLFAMVDDIPSVARSVRVTEAPTRFLRGDSNADGVVSLSDALFTLSYLFRDGVEPPCLDAAEANDDSIVDVSDAVYLLRSLFEGLAGLDTDCGTDQTVDEISCKASGCL